MKRIQRQRTKGWRMPRNTVYVGRPSRWGNPYRVGDTYMWIHDLGWPFPSSREPGEYDYGLHVERCASVEQSLEWYRRWITQHVTLTDVLRGRNLACWCPLDQPCHADILLELAG